MPGQNPTETAYVDLLAALRNSPDVQELVQPGNIHGNETEEVPVLGHHMSGDMPHLEFSPVPGGQQWLVHDDTHSLAEVPFKLRLLTDTELLQGDRGLWAVEWAIHRTLYRRAKAIMPGDCLIHVAHGDFGPLDPYKGERLSGERGWCAEMTITAKVNMNSIELTA
jgi:hypothetical protein